MLIARTKSITGFLLAAIVSASIGCSDGRGPTVEVTGKVTLDGKPFSKGCIWFTSPTTGAGFHQNLSSDGTYAVKVKDVKLGDKYLVHIGGIESEEDASQEGNPKGVPVPPVPPKYRDAATSGLTATIDNTGKNSFDFELTSN